MSYIATVPDIQGRGIGKSLIKAFVDEAKKHDGKFVYITTDAHNNDIVNCFYQTVGFKIKRVFNTSRNRTMNEYWLAIN